MVLSCGLHLSLCGTLVVVATEAIAIAIMAVVTAMQEVMLLRQGNVMVLCNGDKARESAANNAGWCNCSIACLHLYCAVWQMRTCYIAPW